MKHNLNLSDKIYYIYNDNAFSYNLKLSYTEVNRIDFNDSFITTDYIQTGQKCKIMYNQRFLEEFRISSLYELNNMLKKYDMSDDIDKNVIINNVFFTNRRLAIKSLKILNDIIDCNKTYTINIEVENVLDIGTKIYVFGPTHDGRFTYTQTNVYSIKIITVIKKDKRKSNLVLYNDCGHFADFESYLKDKYKYVSLCFSNEKEAKKCYDYLIGKKTK